jgi:hypothetical protein
MFLAKYCTSIYRGLVIIEHGDYVGLINEETLKMRYIALVKKGLLEDDECAAYTKKIDISPCMKKKVDKFEDFFLPGTVLLSDKASYRLRVEYPME